MHPSSHPLGGRTAVIREGTVDPAQNLVVGGAEFELVDWWDRISGDSWQRGAVPLALHYAYRSGVNRLPRDDEVLYGRIRGLGHLVHASEIEYEGDLAEMEMMQ